MRDVRMAVSTILVTCCLGGSCAAAEGAQRLASIAPELDGFNAQRHPGEMVIALPPDAADQAPAAPPPVIINDILAQLPQGFVLPYRDTRAVRAEFNWYLRNPDYLDRVFTRAQTFLPHIVDELRQRGMPMEIALLPVVESAFDPFAYSHGRAAGLWQFIPATGRRFGLAQNWWYDGRRDIIESTRAALDYLERLQRMFDGDWLLAIAAYNSGEGKVRRALRRAGGDATFWELALPRETRAYVPRLLALSRLVASPGDFGIVLPIVADLPQFTVVETGGQIDLALAAGLAGTDIETIYRYNPGLNRWATPPEGPHRLVMPLYEAEVLREKLASLPPEQRLRFERYQVVAGDTLSEIAARHKVTVVALRDANRLRGSNIRAGDHLLIPSASAEPAAYALSADARLARKIEQSGDALRYTVREGDSLWTIARQYGMSVRKLAAANGMAPRDTLSVGRELVISNSTASTPQVNGLDAVGPGEMQRRIRYVVRKGDSLSSISSRFRVSIAELKRWNSAVANQKYLYPGQKLLMYIDVRKQSGG